MKMHELRDKLKALGFSEQQSLTPRVALCRLIDHAKTIADFYEKMCGFATYDPIDSPKRMREAVEAISEKFKDITKIINLVQYFLPEFLEIAEIGANDVELIKITESLASLLEERGVLVQRQTELAASHPDRSTDGPYR